MSSSAQSTTDSLGLTGETLAGKYRIDRVIGEGGTGLVYEGTNLLLGARVAVKCTKPGEGTQESFLKEAKLLFSFSHPNVVRLYDAGQIDSPRGKISYVVLEYLDGISLDAEIASRQSASRHFNLTELRTILEAVLEALAAAHARGLMHRDMKPSNVMIGPDGSVKVLDFGTARLVTQATRFSSQFTPRYAAPEQWEPERGEAGTYTDVFGAGLLLYEMTTLVPAFEGKDLPSILKACLHPERPTIIGRRPQLAALVQPVLDRALALEPRARYRDASEMLAAVRSSLVAGAARQNPTYASTVPLSNAPPARHTPSGIQAIAQRTLPLAPPAPRPPPASQRETARMAPMSSAPEPSLQVPMGGGPWWLVVAVLVLIVLALAVWLVRAMLSASY